MADQVFSLCRRSNKSELHKYVRSKGKNVVLDSRTGDNQTCLHVASENGKDEIVTLLVEKYKLDVNAVDSNGWTPLHSACKGGHTKIIKLLLGHGAFPRPLTNEGSSPLHYFVRNDCTDDKEFNDIITTLVKKGCTVDLQNTHGEAPLHQAAMRGRHYCLLILLNNGANPNLQTRFGETALHFAVRGGHAESINILLNFGADPFISGKEAGTIFKVAKKFRTPSIRNILREYVSSRGLGLPQELADTAEQDEQAAAKRATKKRETAVEAKKKDDKEEKDAPAATAASPEMDDDRKKKSRKTGYKKEKSVTDRVSSRRRSNSVSSAPKGKEGRSNRSSTFLRPFVALSSGSDKDPSKEAAKEAAKERLERAATATPTETEKAAESEGSGEREEEATTAAEEKGDETPETLGERIERLKNRVRDSDAKPPSPGPSRKSVIALAKTFEGADDDFSQRIEKLKRDVSNVINVDSLESEVRGQEKGEIVREDGCQLSQSEVKNRYLLSKLKDGWKCKVCKAVHQDVPLAFFCGNPHDYEDLDDEAKKSRAKVSSDLCSIDNQRFYVRGLVEVPVLEPTADGATDTAATKGGKKKFSDIKLVWGIWVQVDAQEFFKIMEKWSDDAELTIPGMLGNIMQPYPDTLNQPVTMKTRPGGLRPLVTLDSPDNSLAKEVRDGVSFKRLETLVESVLHNT
eukprot:CAMPEP_0114624238 /NCGR_PEP_ID=MMETSP0168-20121206/10666_1 /TAXON_ID=95228 ORGANISM="Vannella sp., Strain DIVA3 517/6/12" /NCGR_SAMPLE_ID=MMETSP0168 /ASSEMBLY_ACC=CAM_ASM_000044 /LENGTH=687 /DNA_ID=CAMNT_0001835511 /DNA_START=177 /DNA_END=2236 /DNA_ORIENTATION=+